MDYIRYYFYVGMSKIYSLMYHSTRNFKKRAQYAKQHVFYEISAYAYYCAIKGKPFIMK